jgi:cell division initiation protein
MRLSPLDIQHMEFQRGAGGYHRRQVREFLERLALEREELVGELQAAHEDLDRKDAIIEELQTAEAELQRAIIAAERIGNEIKENAKKEAQLILQGAERLKEDRLHAAEERLREVTGEVARLEREYALFREQFRGMLEAYGRALESEPRRGRSASDGRPRRVTLDIDGAAEERDVDGGRVDAADPASVVGSERAAAQDGSSAPADPSEGEPSEAAEGG